MFDFFKKITKQINNSNITSLGSSQEKNKKLYVVLSSRYLSYRLEDGLIQYMEFPVDTMQEFSEQLQIWFEAIQVIIKTLEFTPEFVFFIHHGKFIVKNAEKFIDVKYQNRHFANKLAIDESKIDVRHLQDKSYLIIDFDFIQKILFKFKDYTISGIYDMSLLATEYLSLSGVHCYINISYDNFDIILNNRKIQKRTITDSLSKFLEQCSAAIYTDMETSYTNLKNSFKSVTSYQELKEINKPLQKELLAYIDSLANNIEQSLSYFSVYDIIENVDKVYIDGDILEFDFMIKILNDKLNIDAITINKFMKLNTYQKADLELFSKLESKELEKYHLDFEGLRYSDGRDEYIFVENKFIAKGHLSATQKTKINEEKESKEYNPLEDDEEISEILDMPIWKMSMGELYSFAKEKLNLKKSGSLNVDLVYYGIFIVGIFFLVLFLLTSMSDTQREFKNNILTYEDRVKRVDSLKQKLSKDALMSINTADSEIKKILWTQKFITLSNLMPNEIWLASVSMKNYTKTIEDKEVTSQALVLEARALPSATGHVSSIANYMQELLNADDEFKKDFSSIHFGGAKIINEYGYDVIHFTLICQFEKNINVKTIEDKTKKTKNKSIGENLQSINQNIKVKEKILNSLDKGSK